MQNQDSSNIIQIPVEKITPAEFIQRLQEENRQLREENHELRRTIDKLINQVAVQTELIQQLRDEIAILKGQKPKPTISPSRLEGPGSKPPRSDKPGQPKGTRKKRKTSLEIHKEVVIEPSNIPEGAVFKGYCPYIVQNIQLVVNNTRYLLER